MNMFREILSDLRSMNRSNPAMRAFGLLFGLILFVLAGFILFRRGLPSDPLLSAPVILLIMGILSIGIAVIKPQMLKPVNTVLVIISMCIGYCVTRVVLVIIFYGMFLPIGCLLRLFGKDALRMKKVENVSSYWIVCPDEPFDRARCRRLF
jgi:glucan phosphoethanolaminetransferase (alkaline phosphatase superfamily)